VRDRARFDLAIDTKVRGCDIVRMRIGHLVSGGRVRTRADLDQTLAALSVSTPMCQTG
jgi:hypothetical protein